MKLQTKDAHRSDRFILLGHGRSGSTLLLLALRQHPDIQMYGELLTDEPVERSRAFLRTKPVYRDGEDAAEYLRQVIFSADDLFSPLAVGFKILYNHAQSDKYARKAWDYLMRERSIRVIHLLRRNLFKCCISHEVAYRTNVWAWDSNDRKSPPVVSPLRIDPLECKGFIETMLERRAWAFRRFKAHPQMTIEYEQDLCGDFQGTMNRIFDFLNVRRLGVRKLISKQAILSPRDQVSNFNELKKFFAGSDHASFFE